MSRASRSSPSLKQTDLDEITVPPVHLVESAARNDVGMREIQKPVFANALRIRRQRSQLDGGEFFLRQHLANLSRHAFAVLLHRHVHGPWRAGSLGSFGSFAAVGRSRLERDRVVHDVLMYFLTAPSCADDGSAACQAPSVTTTRTSVASAWIAVAPLRTRYEWLIRNMFHGATDQQETYCGRAERSTTLELL